MSAPNPTTQNQTQENPMSQNDSTTNALFDVETVAVADSHEIQRIPLEDLTLAPNPRNDISEDGIDRLARMLATTGQLIPAIGYRDNGKVAIYDGQRRLLAARRTQTILEADEPGTPLTDLLVIVLAARPTPAALRRLQAQANQHEALSLADQRRQFSDCWTERAGLTTDLRIKAVCSDLGISPKFAHNLLRQIELPYELAARVSSRPVENELSVTLANDLHAIATKAPRLAAAVAEQVVDRISHDDVRRDMVGAVHRAVAQSDAKDVFARRLTLGQMVPAQAMLDEAAPHLHGADVPRAEIRRTTDLLRPVLSGETARRKDETIIDEALKTLSRTLSGTGAHVEITQEILDLANGGQSTITVRAGERNATYLVDPVLAVSLVVDVAQAGVQQLEEKRVFSAAGDQNDEELRAAADREAARRAQQRQLQENGRVRNHDLGSQLRDKVTYETLGASGRRATAQLCIAALLEQFGDLALFGAAWSDTAFEQTTPGGMGKEPMEPHVILDRLAARAMEASDPMEGVVELITTITAGALLDPDGVPRGKALGRDRMERRISRQLPVDGGADSQSPKGRVRRNLWTIAEPHLQPALRDMHQDAFAPELDGDDFRPQDLPREVSAGDLDLSGIDLGDEDDLSTFLAPPPAPADDAPEEDPENPEQQ
ncbi:MAG: hypothetical protein F2825_00525 [Actinobacteria bacterium]|uniref:Unannotated protein n=1 Tax=freshwater metagenome TaxID=449393 RepID=A0A6J7FU87_9ZZZZ|nr:hypothetical protein [Actinomycetota bacterium]